MMSVIRLNVVKPSVAEPGLNIARSVVVKKNFECKQREQLIPGIGTAI